MRNVPCIILKKNIGGFIILSYVLCLGLRILNRE